LKVQLHFLIFLNFLAVLDHHLRVVPEEVDTHLLRALSHFCQGVHRSDDLAVTKRRRGNFFSVIIYVPKGKRQNKSVLDIFFSLRVCKYYLYTRTDVLRTTTTTARKIQKKPKVIFSF
jgi:hypothetical protein